MGYITYCTIRADSTYKHLADSLFKDDYPAFNSAVEQYSEVMMSVDNASLVSVQIYAYIRDEMTPYFTGEKDYDTCFERPINVLTLYKDD